MRGPLLPLPSFILHPFTAMITAFVHGLQSQGEPQAAVDAFPHSRRQFPRSLNQVRALNGQNPRNIHDRIPRQT